MAKAILVVDMPERCAKCNFMYEFQGVKKCQLKNVLTYDNPVLSQVECTAKKSSNCPLKPMPEKIDMRFLDDKSEYYRQGFNACIDAICGKE